MPVSNGNGWEQIAIGAQADVLITFAGLSLTLTSSHAWAVALAAAIPGDAGSGVGEAFAVAGPPAPLHVGSLVEALAPHFAQDDPKRILVVAHSSGVDYADKLFGALMQNEDAKKAKRLFYYDLDGGSQPTVNRSAPLFSQAYAVSGHIVDAAGSTVYSRNYDHTKAQGASLQAIGLGEFVDLDLGGKRGSDQWPPDPNILHMALVNFAKPVWFLDAKPEKLGADYAPFYVAGDINSTYATCTEENVTADYIGD